MDITAHDDGANMPSTLVVDADGMVEHDDGAIKPSTLGQSVEAKNNAQDDSEKVIGDDGSKTIYVGKNTTVNGQGTSEDPYNNLKLALDDSNDGDTIIVNKILDNKGKEVSYKGTSNIGLTISKSVTIKSGTDQVTFNGENKRIFTVSAPNVLISGLRLVSGSATNNYGGAVLVNQENCTLNNCYFYNDKALYGGAVFINGPNCVIDDCEFSSNKATSATAYTRGGAIYINSNNALINNSKFSSGNRADYGGAIFAGLPAVINNTDFHANYADYWGGALFGLSSSSKSIIENCNFSSNQVIDSYGVTYGGAVALQSDDNKFKNCNFTNNFAPDNGGAVLVQRSNNQFIDCYFEKNVAGRGGAVDIRTSSKSNSTNTTFINSTFVDNGIKDSKGGAIHSYCDYVNITGCNFTNNKAIQGGAILFAMNPLSGITSDNNTIRDSIFTNNTAFCYGGGAISSVDYNAKIINSTFKNNKAHNYGGALSINGVHIVNSTFEGNEAPHGKDLFTYNSTIESSTSNGDTVALNDVTTVNSDVNNKSYFLTDYVHVTNYDEVADFDSYYFVLKLDNGYYGYCIEDYADAPSYGVLWDKLSVRNRLNGKDVSEYLKILIYDYFENCSDIKALQKVVSEFSDHDYLNSDNETVQAIIAKYNSGFRVNDTERLANGSLKVFNFKSLVTPHNTQNLFVFNISYYVPNMTITKIANDKVAVLGQDVSFTIVVNNTGDYNLTGVYVIDKDFGSGLKYKNFTDVSGLWKFDGSHTWNYDGVLAVGNSSSFVVIYTTTSNGTQNNTAIVGSNYTNESNSTNETTVYRPGLSIVKISNNDIVTLGSDVSFTLVIENTGEANLTGVYVSDKDYTSGLVYKTFVDKTGKWIFDGRNTWNYNGVLEAGKNASFDVIFTATTLGIKNNTAVVGSDNTNESNSTNDTEVVVPKLTLTEETEEKVVEVGEDVTFDLTVTNTGQVNLTGVYIKDQGPSSGLKYKDYEDETGDWEFDGKDTWHYKKTLGVNESATLKVTFTALTPGKKTNPVVAGSNQTEETTSSNSTKVIKVKNSTDDSDKPEVPDKENKTLDEVSKVNKVAAVNNATGNPLFMLLLFLAVLGICPIKRN